MNLATDKDNQVEPLSIPVPGSSSASQPQNSTTNRSSVGKRERRQKVLLGAAEKHQESLGAQRSGERRLGVRRGSDPSQFDDSVSPHLASHSGTNGCLNSTDNHLANGKSTREQARPAMSEDQTPASSAEIHSQQGMQGLSNNFSTQVTNPTQTNGQAKNSLDNSSHPPPTTGGGPPTNGNAIPHLDAPRSSDSTTTSLPTASPRPKSAQGDNDTMMIDSDEGALSSGNAISDTEPPPKRTRSRQKRPSDALSKQPAKRARTSSNVSASTSYTLEKSVNGFHDESGECAQDIEMRAAPLSENAAPTSSNLSAISTSTIDSIPVQDPTPTVPRPEAQGTSLSITVNTNLEPKLDPALAASSSSQPANGSSQSTALRPSDAPTGGNSSAEGSASGSTQQAKHTTPSPTSASSLANNPYIGLSTAFLKGGSTPGTTGYNPYALYYGPGTPLTPHTPTYAYPYLYHLHSPISAQAMYPASPSFVPSPTTAQKSPPAPGPTGGEPQRQKPKRLKAHTVTSGNHNIPIVPRDKKGKPMLPLNVGIMTVIRLGEICIREHFHTERYIFPVGYEVTRRYLSTMDPNGEVVYHCTILDGGDGPKFQIVPSDAPDRTVIAGTATGAWSSIVKQANAIRSRQHSNSVSGPDFFGLGQNTIKHLIQELPNADRLRDYVWQNFIEGGPLGGRHAAVTPALPEDYDSTLPIGALYPAERDRLKREISASPRGLNYYPQHIIAQAEAQQKQQGSAQASQQHTNPPVLNHPLPPTSTMTVPPALDPRIAIPNGHIGVMPPIPAGQQSPATSVPQDSSPQAPATSQPPNPPASPPTAPTTIVGIMNAYPIPSSGSNSAPVSASTSSSASASSSSS